MVGPQKNVLGSNPRVMAQWYSPCLGPGTSKRFMGSNPRVMAQWYSPLFAMVGPQKNVLGSNPRVMAQWHIALVWDLRSSKWVLGSNQCWSGIYFWTYPTDRVF